MTWSTSDVAVCCSSASVGHRSFGQVVVRWRSSFTAARSRWRSRPEPRSSHQPDLLVGERTFSCHRLNRTDRRIFFQHRYVDDPPIPAKFDARDVDGSRSM